MAERILVQRNKSFSQICNSRLTVFPHSTCDRHPSLVFWSIASLQKSLLTNHSVPGTKEMTPCFTMPSQRTEVWFSAPHWEVHNPIPGSGHCEILRRQRRTYTPRDTCTFTVWSSAVLLCVECACSLGSSSLPHCSWFSSDSLQGTYKFWILFILICFWSLPHLGLTEPYESIVQFIFKKSVL